MILNLIVGRIEMFNAIFVIIIKGANKEALRRNKNFSQQILSGDDS